MTSGEEPRESGHGTWTLREFSERLATGAAARATGLGAHKCDAGRILAQAVEQTGDAVLIADAAGRVRYVNPAFEVMSGYQADEVLGQPVSILKSGEHSADFYADLWRTIVTGQVFRAEFVNRRKNGELYFEEKTISPIRDADGAITHYVSTAKDVTERVHFERRLNYLANHDPLTGLPNRNLFFDRLDQALVKARRTGQGVALFCMDVDHFKKINDTLGHAAGDHLLRDVGRRLRDCVRAEDTIARLGGDEFILILGGLACREDAERVARKILDAFLPPFRVEHMVFHASVSIGISLFPDSGGGDSHTLLRQADLAMYRAKAAGRNGHCFYAAEMGSQAEEELRLESQLRGALGRGEFRLHYQPQIDPATRRTVGVEALLRWEHPELGLLPPGRFLHLLEGIGRMDEVTRWVLRTACAEMVALDAAGFLPLRVAVNVTGGQIKSGWLVEGVRQALAECGLAPGRLEIEVTENVLLEDIIETEQALDALAGLGVTIAVDDFGTGYSSLSYLPRFAIHTLKIDCGLVGEIGRHERAVKVIRAVLSLARSLDLALVAEGVTSEIQLDFLRSEGCDLMQGFLFSRPIGVDELKCFLANAGTVDEE